MEPNCIFCKIISGEVPSEIVYSDDKVVVFKDINPQAPVHLLIVPRVHIEAYKNGYKAYEPELLGYLFHIAEIVAEKAGVKESGYRLIVNTGPDSGQEVPHLHMHLLAGKKLGRLIGG